jgi:anti-anti-sigma factor
MASMSVPFDVSSTGGTLRLVALVPLVASNIAALRAALKEHLGAAEQAVLLDLGHVELVDSLGIYLVVSLNKSCQERQVSFSVAGANAEVLRLFEFFGLNEVFDIREG